MAKCEKCKNYEKEIQGCLYMDADCVNGSMFEPFTNYDRIKNMSIDELSEFLHGLTSSLAVKLDGEYVINETEQIKEWLESEAE